MSNDLMSDLGMPFVCWGVQFCKNLDKSLIVNSLYLIKIKMHTFIYFDGTYPTVFVVTALAPHHSALDLLTSKISNISPFLNDKIFWVPSVSGELKSEIAL